MEAYTGNKQTLPDDCLDLEFQTKLDQDLAAVFLNVLKFDLMSAWDSLMTFGQDMQQIGTSCNLDIIKVNFDADMKKNGLFWVFANFASQFMNIESLLFESLEKLVSEDWEGSGASMG